MPADGFDPIASPYGGHHIRAISTDAGVIGVEPSQAEVRVQRAMISPCAFTCRCRSAMAFVVEGKSAP